MKDANGFKIIKVNGTDAIPACDLCRKNPGIYDGPCAGHGSSWANICQTCFDLMEQTNKDYIKTVGGKREPVMRSIQNKVKDPNAILVAKELTDMMDCLSGEDREVECPACGETRLVEPDADYTFKCEGCGAQVKCAAII